MMESWTRVIVEWINCLGIAQPPVENVNELQDCVLYKKLVLQLCPKNGEDSASTSTTAAIAPLDERELVTEFIRTNYPNFMTSNESATGITDEVYVGSLLLAQCSQKIAFHRPMCVNLKQETQIHIKKFLEVMLPCGNNVTREDMEAAITEMGDATPGTPPSTPVVRPLREFFNSPAAKSAQSQKFLNERNRELRFLRAQLETERFEKADLLEDIAIQESKIKSLQMKVQEQSRELKAARSEISRPTTPQSCRKKRLSLGEERYRKELQQLDSANADLQSEIEKVREEREELARRFASKERLHSALKEKLEQYERSIEILSLQLEDKNSELLELRMNNEELREHVREIQRPSIGEQSFEIETIRNSRSPIPHGSSEALSSIIDIQLQEAREESKQLQRQLDVANERLECAVRDCEEMERLRIFLREKSMELEAQGVCLRRTEEQLSSSEERAFGLESRNLELDESLTKLNETLATYKRLLALADNRGNTLESELADAASKNLSLEDSLEKQRLRILEMESTAQRVENECEQLRARLASTENDVIRVSEAKSAMESNLLEERAKLEESSRALAEEKSRVVELEAKLVVAEGLSENLETKLGSYEQRLSSTCEEKDRLESQLREHEMKIEESESRLRAEVIRVAELNSAAILAKEEYERVRDLLKSCEESLSLVSADKITLQSSLEECKTRLEDTETCLRDEKSAVEDLRSNLTLTEKKYDDLKVRLEATEEKLSGVRRNNELLESNLAESRARLEDTETCLRGEKSVAEDLRSNLTLTEKKCKGLELRLEATETELSGVKSSNEALQSNLEDSNRKLKEFKASLSDERDRSAELKSTISIFRSESENLHSELRRTRESLTAKVADLESVVAREVKHANELENSVELLKDALEKEKTAVAELETIASRSKEAHAELETQMRAKERLLEESLQRESSLNAESEVHRQEISDLRNSLRSEVSKAAELETMLACKERALNEAETLKASTESELERARTEVLEMENLRMELLRVEEEKTREILTNKRTEERARGAEEKIVELEAKIAEHERNFENFEKAAMQERQSLENLRTELVNKNSALEELSRRLEEAKETEISSATALKAAERRTDELAKLEEETASQLTREREQLVAIRAEKESLKEKLTLHARSQADMQIQISELSQQLEDSGLKLQEQIDANTTLKKNSNELQDAKCELENKLAQVERQSSALLTEKLSLEQELASLANSVTNATARIADIEAELQKQLESNSALRRDNVELKELQSRTGEDLEKAREELAAVQTERDILQEESSMLTRENDLLNASFKKRAEESDCLVATLKKQLATAEKSCAKAELEERLKEETLGVLRSKLEQLTKEKVDSELRMKEVITNLQEVRSSQEGVLEAQLKALKEKSSQLEEAERELLTLKNSLTAKVDEVHREKSSRLETELREEKLKEQNQVQSNLIKELRIALDIERSQLEEATTRCATLKNNAEQVAGASKCLKVELDALWKLANGACPEIVRSREAHDFDDEDFGNSEAERLSPIVRSFAKEVGTIHGAFSALSEDNRSLKNGMKELAQVSRSLKLELNALWDSVRRACPELARPNAAALSLDLADSSEGLEIVKVSRAVESFAEDARGIRKAVSILSEANETLKEHLDGEKECAREAGKKKIELDQRIVSIEEEQKNRKRHLASLVQTKKNIREMLSTTLSETDRAEERLETLTEKWRNIAEEAQKILVAGGSACDELKHLQLKRNEIEEFLKKINKRYTAGSRSLVEALCRVLAWSEAKLQQNQRSCSEEQVSKEWELSEERQLVDGEIRQYEKIRSDLLAANESIEKFSSLLETYKANVKSGAVKRESSTEEKLQLQIDKLVKEKKEAKGKLDAMRMRNAKMEKNMDDLRNENKKLKADASNAPTVDLTEFDKLRTLTGQLQEQVSRLQLEKDELASKKGSDEQDIEARLKEVHNEYGLKLEKIKQKMKTAYNEQIAKQKEEHEKMLKEKMDALRVQMEKQCRKYTEDIAKYKAHISDLSSRYWDVGEKLLAETQEKQSALRQLEQQRGSHEKREGLAEVSLQTLSTQSRLKTASLDRRDYAADRATIDYHPRSSSRAVGVIEEETTTISTRRQSVRSIQAMGNAFRAEDEESEVFDSVYLADLKEGKCAPEGPDMDRIMELRTRNSLCRPHLKSSYAVETHFQPITLNEDDIKNGVNADDVFNDSLSQSLLPGQKPKKKDRTQTSYKRPGPPTPSKNGGRLSLQGNEMRSPMSRVLRERNVERRTTATPRGLKNLFGTSTSKRQGENGTESPKGRRLSSIFRKQRTERN